MHTNLEKSSLTQNTAATSKFFSQPSKDKTNKYQGENNDAIIHLAGELFKAKLKSMDTQHQEVLGDMVADLETLLRVNNEEKKCRLKVFTFYLLFERPHDRHNFGSEIYALMEAFIKAHFKEMDANQKEMHIYVQEKCVDEEISDSWRKKCQSVQDTFKEFNSLLDK